MQNITTTRERVELRGLEKFTNYSVQVLAFTQAGDGVRSSVLHIQTKEDGECLPAPARQAPRAAAESSLSRQATHPAARPTAPCPPCCPPHCPLPTPLPAAHPLATHCPACPSRAVLSLSLGGLGPALGEAAHSNGEMLLTPQETEKQPSPAPQH